MASTVAVVVKPGCVVRENEATHYAGMELHVSATDAEALEQAGLVQIVKTPKLATRNRSRGRE
jgi:hypothetical protein